MITSERLAWRAALLLILGYMAYYFCRTNFSVGRPSQLLELAQGGVSHEVATVALGRVATFGVIAGICGKLLAGRVVAKLGGVGAFVLGGLGAALATVAFGFSNSIPLFGVCWGANRIFQAVGWPAAVRIVGSWFPAGSYGKAMGIVSLAWLFGDALSRAIPKTHEPVPLRQLFARPAFLGVCVGAFGFTLVNVTLSEWLPVYFTGIGLSQGSAALASGLYPLMGGVSAVAFGAWGDRIGGHGRQKLLLIGLLLTALSMAGFLLAKTPTIAFVLVAFSGLVAGGPYAYTVGAAALDLVESKQAASVNGIIDGVGYLGAILAGEALARLAVALGWNGAFAALAGVCLLASTLCAILNRQAR
ncbi:MAG: MFS transporter [Armatimonadetes bacterium]|nr:MFS transporter [Armatimonadota bacterium]